MSATINFVENGRCPYFKLDDSYKGSNWSQWCCPPSPFNTKTVVGLRRDILLSAYCNSCEASASLFNQLTTVELRRRCCKNLFLRSHTRVLLVEWRSRMVEVAGIEPACPNIRSKASTCLSRSLISPSKLQQAEFPIGSLSKLRLIT